MFVVLVGGRLHHDRRNRRPPPSTFGTDSPWLGTLTAVALPAPVNSLTSLDCASATRCWAVGSTVGGGGVPNGAAVISTTDGGSQMDHPGHPAHGGLSLSGIACSDALRCTAVGQASQASAGQAVIITTADGGVQWTQVPAPPGVLDLTAVSCLADGWCMAVGAAAAGSVALVSTTSGPAGPRSGALPASHVGSHRVSCTGQPATAGSPATPRWPPTTWSEPWPSPPTAGPTGPRSPRLPGIGYLNGVSCLSGPPTGSGAFPVPPPRRPRTSGGAGAATTASTVARPRRAHHHDDHPPTTPTTAPPTTTAPPRRSWVSPASAARWWGRPPTP